MIGLPTHSVNVSPCGVPKQYRDAARQRSGEWEIVTWDWDFEHPDVGCMGRMFGLQMAKMCGYDASGRIFQKTVIVLKEAEVPRLMHQIFHGIRNKTKIESIQSNLEQTAQTLWPNGSLEHVAMRWLAVPMMMRVCYGHQVKLSRFHVACLAMCCQFTKDKKTQLLRRSDSLSGALNHCDGKDTNSKSAVGKGSCDGDSPQDKPDDKGPIHGGSTPEDADIIANEHDRVVDVNGVKLIVGQDFDGVDQDNKQIVGVLTAPTPKKPNVYNNSSANAKAAKRERLDKKARPFTGTKIDVKKISRFIGEACGTKGNRAIFLDKRIQKWAENFFHLEDIKSGKWSFKRLEDSLNNLLKEAFPKMNLKCAVKLEPMQEGKPPRLLIADGDDGQLMAMVVVRCFEDLLFSWFEEKSIKHLPKRRAVRRCVDRMAKNGAKLVEGDGSAWDTTCNATIRSLVENPVLRHIMQVLIPYGVVPQQWHEEHINCCDKKKLKLFFQKKWDKMRMTIDAIRRSGHRGTSCLNWWMNFTNWACSIYKQPERFLDPTVRKGEDETGHERWWYGCFEGDDSLCALFPPMRPEDSMDEIFMSWWSRMGFNMKIVYVSNRATFCGYHIACNEGEVSSDSFICPELPRAMVGAGVSCSSTIIAAAKAGDVKTVRDIAAAGALARAADFAGLLPSVSRKYHTYALDIKHSTEVVDREMSYRVMGMDGYKFSDLEKSIENQNLSVTPTEEHMNLRALECPATQEELETFVLYPWSFECVGDHEGYLASLPASWRPPQ